MKCVGVTPKNEGIMVVDKEIQQLEQAYSELDWWITEIAGILSGTPEAVPARAWLAKLKAAIGEKSGPVEKATFRQTINNLKGI